MQQTPLEGEMTVAWAQVFTAAMERSDGLEVGGDVKDKGTG